MLVSQLANPLCFPVKMEGSREAFPGPKRRLGKTPERQFHEWAIAFKLPFVCHPDCHFQKRIAAVQKLLQQNVKKSCSKRLNSLQ